jgi:hypothetical protein
MTDQTAPEPTQSPSQALVVAEPAPPEPVVTRVPRLVVGAATVGAVALGALAVGTLAIGTLAVGSLAIGKLGVGRARLRKVEIGDLVVRRLTVIEVVER